MKFTIVIVSYNNLDGLKTLVQSLQNHCSASAQPIEVKVFDNSEEPNTKNTINDFLANANDAVFSFDYIDSPTNVGFGTAVNRIDESLPAPESSDDWLLVLNQDVELVSDILAELMDKLPKIDAKTAAVELRQLPYEHPKVYHPSTQTTTWISGAAFAVRRQAFREVGGFDERLFLYAEDVDLSWRLRAAGYQLQYLPQLAVYHHTVEVANQVKPAQIIEGTLNNLCLRARYGRFRDIAIGLAQLAVEIVRKPNFSGRRKAMLMIYPRFAKRFWSFYQSGKDYRKTFIPDFLGWNFAEHRRGAYHPAKPFTQTDKQPLVSILIRTQNRPFYLREAILSALNQTYQNIEVIVVEDGENHSQALIDELADARIRYHAIGQQSGRSNAGNVALSLASGEWLNFLDDDDQLYADHVETLLAAALNSDNQVKATYGATFEVMTEYQPTSYTETKYYERYCEPYSVFTLLKHNFLPIQSVLFSRELYQQYGGFNDELDMLEDWNLWLKYGRNERFMLVEKTTSKYRVPAAKQVATNRKAGFQQAFENVVADQQSMSDVTISVKDAQQMLDIYLASKQQMEAEQRRIEILTTAKWYKRLCYQGVYLVKDVLRHCRK